MFTKLSSEKIGSTICQGLWKEQKQNSDAYQTECRKGNADDYHTIECEKSGFDIKKEGQVIAMEFKKIGNSSFKVRLFSLVTNTKLLKNHLNVGLCI